MKSFSSPSEQERVKQLLDKTGGSPLLIHPNTTITTLFCALLGGKEHCWGYSSIYCHKGKCQSSTRIRTGTFADALYKSNSEMTHSSFCLLVRLFAFH